MRQLISLLILVVLASSLKSQPGQFLQTHNSSIAPASLVQEQWQETKFNPFKDYTDGIFASVGLCGISGTASNTMKMGFEFSIADVGYRLKNDWIVIGVSWLDLSFHGYRLTAKELQDVSEKYSVVTKTNGVVTSVEPVESITIMVYKFSLSASVQFPEHQGFVATITKRVIARPFAGVGISLNYLNDASDFEGGPEFGFNPFARIGFDFALRQSISRYGESGFGFVRLELVVGTVPDLGLLIAPEIRPVGGGVFYLFRAGFGVTQAR